MFVYQAVNITKKYVNNNKKNVSIHFFSNIFMNGTSLLEYVLYMRKMINCTVIILETDRLTQSYRKFWSAV